MKVKIISIGTQSELEPFFKELNELLKKHFPHQYIEQHTSNQADIWTIEKTVRNEETNL